MLLDSARVQLFLLKQVGLILAQVLRTEPVGRLVKMVGEFLDDSNVSLDGGGSAITALSF